MGKAEIAKQQKYHIDQLRGAITKKKKNKSANSKVTNSKATKSVKHSLLFMANTKSTTSNMTIAGGKTYLEDIVVRAIVSQKLEPDGVFLPRPRSEWTDEKHSNRLEFQIYGSNGTKFLVSEEVDVMLSEPTDSMFKRDYCFKMKVEITMSARNENGDQILPRTLILVEDGQSTQGVVNDEFGAKYVTYFTPTEEERKLNKFYGDTYEFQGYAEMVMVAVA